MRITVSSNAEEVSATLRVLFADQLPFATAQALNRTANDVQKAQQSGMGDRFTLRRKTWVERSIKRGKDDWASKKKMEAAVRVEAYGDASRSDVLAQHEKGGVKKPKRGRSLAIPDQIRKNPKKVVPDKERPKAFDFRQTGTNMYVSQKDPRVFMWQTSDGKGGIYKRGRTKAARRRRMASDVGTRNTRDANVTTLYRFTPNAKLKKKFQFEETARGTVQFRYNANFEREYRKAIREAQMKSVRK
jgi:hypothetical protein